MLHTHWTYTDGPVVSGKPGHKVRWLKIDVYTIIYIYTPDQTQYRIKNFLVLKEVGLIFSSQFRY